MLKATFHACFVFCNDICEGFIVFLEDINALKGAHSEIITMSHVGLFTSSHAHH